MERIRKKIKEEGWKKQCEKNLKYVGKKKKCDWKNKRWERLG